MEETIIINYRPKRRLHLLILLYSITLCSWAQTITQQGVAYCYNGKRPRTPLGNVTIIYDSNKRTTLSNELNGTFSLVLDGRKLGDPIGVVAVKKREMMVFNQQAVDEWNVRKEPLCLILCNADEFERQKEYLINIGKREAKKKYEQQKADLEEKLKSSKIKEAEYEAALDKAYEDLERLQKHIGEYADLFARIDESEIDTLAQRAVESFNKGEVDEAIRLFEQGRYMEKLRQANRYIKQSEQLIQIGEQAKAHALENRDKHAKSLKAQIEAYRLQNKWQEVGELLKGLADELSTFENIWAYIEFCCQQLRYSEAELYCQRAFDVIEREQEHNSDKWQFKKATVLYSLAMVYMMTHREVESTQKYQEVLAVIRKLSQKENSFIGFAQVLLLVSMGYNYGLLDHWNKAEELYLEALKQSYRLLEGYEQYSELHQSQMMVLLALASHYRTTSRFHESEDMYLKMLESIQKYPSVDINERQKSVIQSYLASGYTGLAELYRISQRYKESEQKFLDVLPIVRQLAQANPEANSALLADVLKNMAQLYIEMRHFKEAGALLNESLSIQRKLAEDKTDRNEGGLVDVLGNYAKFLAITEHTVESEEAYTEALSIQRQLVEKSPAYKKGLALLLKDFAFLYKSTHQWEKCEMMLTEAIAIQKPLAQKNKELYISELGYMLGILCEVFYYTDRLDECENVCRESIAIFETLAKKNPLQFDFPLADRKGFLADVLAQKGQWKVAKKFAEDAIASFRSMAKVNESYNYNVAGLLGSLSYYSVFMGNYKEAEQYAREGLSTDSTLHFIASNLALALLFQGRCSEAKQIYLQYKKELKDEFLNDFKQLAEAGVIPKEREDDVKMIKRILNE